MTTILIILALVLTLTGLLGCIIPAVPGPPLNLIAMLILQLALEPFRLRTLLIWTAITILVLVLDYLIPLWTARKFGATRQGIYGSLVGMIAGMFFTPVGMVAGLVIGSVIGDLLARQTLSQATRSAAGSLFGTLLSIGLKLACAAWMSLLVFYEVIRYLFA